MGTVIFLSFWQVNPILKLAAKFCSCLIFLCLLFWGGGGGGGLLVLKKAVADPARVVKCIDLCSV